MEFSELILKRQSCRKFSGQPVDKSLLEKMIEEARLSPSACNSQPWFFYAVTSPELVQKIADSCNRLGFNRFVQKAGAFIVIEQKEPSLLESVTKALGSRYFADNDIGIVTAHLALSASNMGLETCILGMFDKKAVGEIVGAGKKATLKLVLAVGYPGEDYVIRDKIRKPIEDIVKFL